MRKTATGTKTTRARAPAKKARDATRSRIHPVVIYPFRQPNDYSDLRGLYQLIARLDAEKDKYARPITVMDRKTYYAMEHDSSFLDFRKRTVGRHSDILD